MRLEIPEFTDWKEEAAFWDNLDTAGLMAEEEGEWVGPGRVRPTPGLCQQCGGQMERFHLDVSMAHGRIILHEVGFFVCPHCGARSLLPDRQEFMTWSAEEPALEQA